MSDSNQILNVGSAKAFYAIKLAIAEQCIAGMYLKVQLSSNFLFT